MSSQSEDSFSSVDEHLLAKRLEKSVQTHVPKQDASTGTDQPFEVVEENQDFGARTPEAADDVQATVEAETQTSVDDTGVEKPFYEC